MEDIARILYIRMVVTRVAMACRTIISTHFIELECLEVKGAAMQASPTLISSSFTNSYILRRVCSLVSLDIV